MKIDVCIPVYNISPAYLKAAIESALAQEEGTVEVAVIVSDDNSTVEYRDIIAGFPTEKIRYFRNRTNLGMVANWNKAVGMGRAPLVMLLGHDDILRPGMFATYLKAFQQNPSAVLCSCGREFIDAHGETVTPLRMVNDRSKIFRRMEKYTLETRQVIYLCLRNGNAIGEPSAVMFTRDVFNHVNGFNPDYRHSADVDFLLRASEKGHLIYFRKPFLLRRLHESNITGHNFSNGIVSRDRSRLFEEYSIRINFPLNTRRRFKASLVAKAVYDMLRAIKSRNRRLLYLAAGMGVKYFEWEPSIYMQYIREFLSGKNIDAM